MNVAVAVDLDSSTLEPTLRKLDAEHVISLSGLEHTPVPDMHAGVSSPDDIVGQIPETSDVIGVQPTTDGVALVTSIVVVPSEAIDGVIVDLRLNAMNHDDVRKSGALAAMSRSSSKADVVPMRSMVVTGTILCLLIAASSILWAFYKFKPGIMTSKDVNQSIQSKVLTFRKPSNGADVSSLPVGIGNGIVYRVNGTALGHHSAVVQTMLSENTPGNTWDGFTALGSATIPTSTGSGVAGLVATESSVTRGTQTQLVTVGLGCPSIRLTVGESYHGLLLFARV